MDRKQVARETTQVLQSYLTYQAVKVIIEQLSETNPPEAVWLTHYSSGKVQDGESYIEGLMLERKDLVMRILTVREHIAEEILEFLPARVKASIEQSNTEHRKQILERLTRSQPEGLIPPEEFALPLEEESSFSSDDPNSIE